MAAAAAVVVLAVVVVLAGCRMQADFVRVSVPMMATQSAWVID